MVELALFKCSWRCLGVHSLFYTLMVPTAAEHDDNVCGAAGRVDCNAV